MNAAMPFSNDLMNQIRRIEIRTRHKVEDLFAGSYLSVFKGRGIEFDEVRPYQSGDDVRSVDWNVTARMGELYVKRFIEERELTILLMVDVSGSQDFGSVGRFKREAVAEMAALLAFAAKPQQRQSWLAAFHRPSGEILPAPSRAAATSCGWCASCSPINLPGAAPT